MSKADKLSESRWAQSELLLKAKMDAGETVVVNQKRHKSLIAWAQSERRYDVIGSATPPITRHSWMKLTSSLGIVATSPSAGENTGH